MKERMVIPVLFPASASSSSWLATALHRPWWGLADYGPHHLTEYHPSTLSVLLSAASCRDWWSRSTWEHSRYLSHLYRDQERCWELFCHWTATVNNLTDNNNSGSPRLPLTIKSVSFPGINPPELLLQVRCEVDGGVQIFPNQSVVLHIPTLSHQFRHLNLLQETHLI